MILETFASFPMNSFEFRNDQELSLIPNSDSSVLFFSADVDWFSLKDLA